MRRKNPSDHARKRKDATGKGKSKNQSKNARGEKATYSDQMGSGQQEEKKAHSWMRHRHTRGLVSTPLMVDSD